MQDPEKSETLEELNVVSEEGVTVSQLPSGQKVIRIEFVPTVPHCSLASLIGKIVKYLCPNSVRYYYILLC